MLRGLAPTLAVLELVGAKPELAGAAVDEGVGEAGDVAARPPGLGVLDDRRVQGEDVIALLKHCSPPAVLEVVLEQHPVVPVVVTRPEPPVDLTRCKHEAASLGQRHDLVHRDYVGSGHRTGMLTAVVRCPDPRYVK